VDLQLTDELVQGASFRTFTIVRSGKQRRIHAPNRLMKSVHIAIRGQVEPLIPAMHNGTAYRPGCSPVKNAAMHAGNRFGYELDLRNAFPSTRVSWTAEAIRAFRPFEPGDLDDQLSLDEGLIEEVLAKFCFENNHYGLVQGGPASPFLYELTAIWRLDGSLQQYCKRKGITYTRYVDDLTFSSAEPIGKHKRSAICKIVRESGFRINGRKARTWDLNDGPARITGVMLSKDGRLAMPGGYLRKTAYLMHQTAEVLSRGGDPVLTRNGQTVIDKHGQPVSYHAVINGLWAAYVGVTYFQPRPLSSLEKRVEHARKRYLAQRDLEIMDNLYNMFHRTPRFRFRIPQPPPPDVAIQRRQRG
jgi:RNA-directed DNA polymerase